MSFLEHSDFLLLLSDFSVMSLFLVLRALHGPFTSLNLFEVLCNILSGLYSCTNISSTQYSITATNVLGAPLGATSTVSAGGAVPQYTTTSGSSVVTVTLNNHTYINGDTFAALISTTVGGVTIFGNYIVSGVASTTFYIQVAHSRFCFE